MNNKITQEYYYNLGISKKILQLLNKELKLQSYNRLSSFARQRRIEALYEALSWEKGSSQENRKVNNLYKLEDYIVGVAKPGKEAAPDYKSCRHYITHEKTNNPNDMLPFILKSGGVLGENMTFAGMFERLEKLIRADMFGLELIGTLLFRAAFMLDHKKNCEGNWRYFPPEDVMKIIDKKIQFVSEFPVRVFLHFLEVLSLNEDVKIHTLGYNDLPHDYGRINTLLTFAHLIAVFLNRRSLAKFAGGFARPPSGMAPLPKTKIALECFPLLSVDLITENISN